VSPPCGHGDTGAALVQVVQQRCLAGSRLAAQDQHPVVTRPCLSQQLAQYRALGPPTTQSRPKMTVGHWLPPRPERQYPPGHSRRKARDNEMLVLWRPYGEVVPGEVRLRQVGVRCGRPDPPICRHRREP
jgi:hypothetical protein